MTGEATDRSGEAVGTAERGSRRTVYFAALVALFGVAVGAAALYVYVQTDRDSRRAAERNARSAAETAGKQLGDSIALVRATVGNLATSPTFEQATSRASCTLTFAFADLWRGHIEVLRPDGSVACSTRLRSASTPLVGYAGSPWLEGAKAEPGMLAPVVDAVTGDRSVLVSTPTSRHWVIAAFIALDSTGLGLERLHVGQPVEFLVTNATETHVLTRSIDAARWVGSPLSGTSFAREAGKVERRDLDGTPRLYAQAPVPGTGWRLFAGVDRASALAAGDRLRRRQLLIILAGFAVVGLAAVAVYRRESHDELQREAAALKVSRARIVHAADAERRRIERNLHDGLQQQLVAVTLGLRLAREVSESDQPQASRIIERLENDLEQTLEELRALAHGVYPPTLQHQGLQPALSAAARRAGLSTRVSVEVTRRHSPDVEATVYFCCLEAINNASKHAGRDASVSVRVWEQAGGVAFEVTDDGQGFASRQPHGIGLLNLEDRVGALGGTLTIESAPGKGTRIVGVVPTA